MRNIQEEKKILSTTSIIGDIVKEIVRDNFKKDILIDGEIDPHSYEMRKGDREKIQNASIIFANGLSLEHNPSLCYQLKKHKSIFLGDSILEEYPELILTIDNEVDPHIWMDLNIMEKLADMICLQVSDIDPRNADIYIQNTENLKTKIWDCDKKIFTLINTLPEEKRYLVSSHDAFNYFANRYFGSTKRNGGENRLCSIQGSSPEGEISLKKMKKVIDFVNMNHVPVIFFESNLPKDAILKVVEVCKGFGRRVRVSEDPLYGDTLGGMSYLQMIEHNARVIVDNLIQEEDDDV